MWGAAAFCDRAGEGERLAALRASAARCSASLDKYSYCGSHPFFGTFGSLGVLSLRGAFGGGATLSARAAA